VKAGVNAKHKRELIHTTNKNKIIIISRTKRRENSEIEDRKDMEKRNMSTDLEIMRCKIQSSKYPSMYISSIIDERIRMSLEAFPEGDSTGICMCTYFSALVGKTSGMLEIQRSMHRSISMNHLLIGIRSILNHISFYHIYPGDFHTIFKLGSIIGKSKYVVRNVKSRVPAINGSTLPVDMVSKIFPYTKRHKYMFPSRHCLTEYNIMCYLQRCQIKGTSVIKGIWFGKANAYLLVKRYKYTLRDCVRAGKFLRMSSMKNLMRSLLRTVSNLHSMFVAHRDIKPSNIMFDCHNSGPGPDASNLVLCDWDAAVLVASCRSKPTTVDASGGVNTELDLVAHTETVGTINYTPPELLDQKSVVPYNPFKMDVWSIGCVFLYILTRETAFTGRTQRAVLSSITDFHDKKQKKKWFDTIRPILHDSGIDFIESCLAVDPSKRITATALLQHPFLA